MHNVDGLQEGLMEMVRVAADGINASNPCHCLIGVRGPTIENDPSVTLTRGYSGYE